MGFWKTLGKIGAIAAPLIAAPFTGGASLAAIGALSGAASGALNGGGVKGALLGAGMGAIPGLGKAGSVVSFGSKMSQLLKAAPGVLTGVSSIIGGGPAGVQQNVQRGVVAGNMADQAAANRAKEAVIGQAGTTADSQALSNVVRAGRLAHYTPPSAQVQAQFDRFGKRLPPVDTGTMEFAGNLQSELRSRLAAGQPLTASGVPAAGAQETADSALARRMAETGGANTGAAGALDTAARAAAMGTQFADLLKKLKPTPVDTSAYYDPYMQESR